MEARLDTFVTSWENIIKDLGPDFLDGLAEFFEKITFIGVKKGFDALLVAGEIPAAERIGEADGP